MDKHPSKRRRHLLVTVLLAAMYVAGPAARGEHSCGHCASTSWICNAITLCVITKCCGAGSGTVTWDSVCPCQADVACDAPSTKTCNDVQPDCEEPELCEV
jgi:hypothetical protein